MKQNKTLFHLTQEHIDRGVKYKSSSCPIALCIAEKLGLKQNIYGVTSDCVVSPNFLHIEDQTLIASSKIAQFIKDFDAGKKVTPFSFKLNIGKNK